MTTRLTLEGTGSFLHLFQAKAVGNSGDPKYSMQLVFDVGRDFTDINAAIQEAITDKFGQNVPPQLHLPISDPRNNPKLASNPFYQGKFYINCNSGIDSKPQLVDQFGQAILDPSQLYSGCRVAASVNFYGYDTLGNRGVAVGLNAVMKLADGERLDNRPGIDDMFAGYINKDAQAPQGGQPMQPQQQGQPMQPQQQGGQPMQPQPQQGQPMQPQPQQGQPMQPQQQQGGIAAPQIDPMTGMPVTYPQQ